MKKIVTGFLGYGVRALEDLMDSSQFDTRLFLIPQQRLGPEVYEVMEKYRKDLEIKIVRDNRELAQELKKERGLECLVMNACPIILNGSVLDRIPVFNIHPGSLMTNRGHHPHLWSVLLGEKVSEITLHRACPAIDLGQVIDKKTVPIYHRDGERELLIRLEEQIPLLLESLYSYLMGEREALEIIGKGIYRRKMEPEDYRIELLKEEPEQMLRKILARNAHMGAWFLWEGKKIFVNHLETEEIRLKGPAKEKEPEGRTGRLILDPLEKTARLRRGDMLLKFSITKIEVDSPVGGI